MIIQTIPKPLTFEEFLAWCPEDGRYELIDGEIIEMQPTGQHEKISSFLNRKLDQAIDRLGLSYFVSRNCLIKPDIPNTSYRPDVAVLEEQALAREPLWQKASTVTLGPSVPLVVEVVSTNWENDYARKLEDYETTGILEYWIVDYLGLGGRRYIGSPKQPTISVYQLVSGEYQVRLFQDSDPIISVSFPDLTLTAEQVFAG